jgi:hypothetical protein
MLPAARSVQLAVISLAASVLTDMALRAAVALLAGRLRDCAGQRATSRGSWQMRIRPGHVLCAGLPQPTGAFCAVAPEPSRVPPTSWHAARHKAGRTRLPPASREYLLMDHSAAQHHACRQHDVRQPRMPAHSHCTAAKVPV